VVISDTIPTFLKTLNEGGNLGVETRSWPDYFAIVADRLRAYGIIPVLVLGTAGLVWLAFQPKLRYLFGLLTACFIVFVLFTLVGYKVDMVLKQVWFVLPAMALGAGAALNAIWDRGLAGKVATTAFCVFLPWTAMVLWVTRIVISHH
jgi:hypothetical protein